MKAGAEQHGRGGIRVPTRLGFRSVLHGIVLAAIAISAFLWLGRGLPRTPWASSDSAGYLAFSPVRPHGYSLFLAGYRLLSNDLAYLPEVQLGLYVTAVLVLAVAVGRRTRSFAASVALLIITFAAADTTTFPYVLSDSIYATAVTLGVAGFLLYADVPRPGFLLMTSVGFGVAIGFRAVGMALLPGFLLGVLIERLGRPGAPIRTAALGALPILLICLGAASSQLAHNGRFVLGSWGGMDLIGKVPLLSYAVPGDAGRLNNMVDEMQAAREKLRQLSPAVQALGARQYYDYLRWSVIKPALDQSWPEWRESDDYQRGQLAAGLAADYIEQDPLGFAHRTAIDLLGLWIMPRWLTEAEREAAVEEVHAAGGLPGLDSGHSPGAELEYYKVVPDPTDPKQVWVFRLVVACFWAMSVGFAAALITSQGRAALIAPDLVLVLVGVHAAYLGTALMEGTYARYIMPTWPALVAGAVLCLRYLRATPQGDPTVVTDVRRPGRGPELNRGPKETR